MEKPTWRWVIQRSVQRFGCLLLAGLVLWGLWITASTVSTQEALDALWNDMALSILRWQLGDFESEDALSPATVLTISQSAFLEVARPAISALWSVEQGDELVAPDDLDQQEKTLINETHTLQTPSTTFEDNGVEALTLTPSSSSDYLVCGDVFISSTTDFSVSTNDILAPFDATLDLDLDAQTPQILILHTHTTEAYTPSNPDDVVYSDTMRTLDTDYNVVSVGAAMAQTFQDMGIGVIHDTTVYDYPSYNDAYDNALLALEAYLEQYPTISFVIDVHRDAIEDTDGNQYKLLTDPEDGVSVAQLALVVGTDGSGFDHPDWLENLRLATAIGQDLSDQYDTLLRPILLRNSRYNQHITTGSLLLEVGAAGNSPQEAQAAGVIFAQTMGALLLAQGG